MHTGAQCRVLILDEAREMTITPFKGWVLGAFLVHFEWHWIALIRYAGAPPNADPLQQSSHVSRGRQRRVGRG